MCWAASSTYSDSRLTPHSFRRWGTFRVSADVFVGHGDPSVVNVGGTVTNVVFPRPGRHRLWLAVDDEPVRDWGLHLVQLPTGLAPSAAAPGTPGR